MLPAVSLRRWPVWPDRATARCCHWQPIRNGERRVEGIRQRGIGTDRQEEHEDARHRRADARQTARTAGPYGRGKRSGLYASKDVRKEERYGKEVDHQSRYVLDRREDRICSGGLVEAELDQNERDQETQRYPDRDDEHQ